MQQKCKSSGIKVKAICVFSLSSKVKVNKAMSIKDAQSCLEELLGLNLKANKTMSLEKCKKHIMAHMEDTQSRAKIIRLVSLLLSWEGVDWYEVNEPGIRFKIFGHNHFLCIKYRKKSAEIHFLNYKLGKYNQWTCVKTPLPDYMSLQQDNIKWVRINGQNINKLSFDVIEQHSRESYRECCKSDPVQNTL